MAQQNPNMAGGGSQSQQGSYLEQGGWMGGLVGAFLGASPDAAQGYQNVQTLRGEDQRQSMVGQANTRANETHQADLATRYADLEMKSRELQIKDMEVQRAVATQKEALNQAREAELESEARLADMDRLLGEGASSKIKSSLENLPEADDETLALIQQGAGGVIDEKSYQGFNRALNKKGLSVEALGLPGKFQGEPTMLATEALGSMAQAWQATTAADTARGVAFKNRITKEQADDLRNDFQQLRTRWDGAQRQKVKEIIETDVGQEIIGEYGDVLGVRSNKPEGVDPGVVATESAQYLLDRKTGKIIKKFGPKPKAAGTTVNVGDKRETKLFESAIKRRDTLRTEATAARQTQQLALTAREAAQRAQTGVGAEKVSELQSFARTIAEITGNPELASQIETGDEEVMRSINEELLLSLISSERAGKASSTDTAIMRRALPGLANSEQGNIAMTNIIEATAIGKQEESSFYATVLDEWNSGLRSSDLGADKAYSEYVSDLPRLTGEGANVSVVNDGRDLWKYYLDGRPKSFNFQNGEAVSVARLKQEAKKEEVSFREYLSALDSAGVIKGVK